MTPAELAAMGLRIKPLAWDAISLTGFRAIDPVLGLVTVHDLADGGLFWAIGRDEMQGPFPSAAEAMAAVDADRAAVVAGLIERDANA